MTDNKFIGSIVIESPHGREIQMSLYECLREKSLLVQPFTGCGANLIPVACMEMVVISAYINDHFLM